MPTESIRVFAIFPVAPERLYRAWLDSQEHGVFTGGAADIEPTVGGAHSSWDGYIWGRFLELDPDRRILATWRTSEFPPGTEDSRIEITFERVGGGTRVTITHTDIPEGQGNRYETGWEDFYFEPMRRHFSAPGEPAIAVIERVGEAAQAPARGARKPKRAAIRKPAVKGARKKAAKKGAKARGRIAAKTSAKMAARPRRVVRKGAKKARPARTVARKGAKKSARGARKAAGRRAKKKAARGARKSSARGRSGSKRRGR